ncbi:heterodisulfide reductase [miscellaneous Crenarchaeota group-15 archaeon DG-45]|uniref:CoB--CoM heterodisulfide reductase iron-sulfur subunit A n=1 Tax=miscellaneous Crenarchaeota group-15 archaeon DG-45 TaxID=1685127 RepID=A0A0M0BS45_9ARCH|nr:MAG: heterodisulfide reductase [miscellaneous Crenarchaeota group-15 archaeon DG-45]
MASGRAGAALVVGGGISGMQASLDLANAGFKVYLVERSPSIGGTMARLDKTFPTMDCAICILAPKMVEVSRHPNIVLLTCAQVSGIAGTAGDFTVEVKRRPRYVDEARCVGCGVCASRCPSRVPDEFQMGLAERRAIYLPFPQSVPLVYSIDPDHCLYLTRGICRVCEKFCEAGAIDFDQREETLSLNVAAVIISPGVTPFDPSEIKEFGYGRYENVVTALELERIVSATGPTKGHLIRPSDKKAPGRVAFIQCVGSRSLADGYPYCSSVCCMHAMKEALLIKEHSPGTECAIFFMDLRAFGKEFEDFYSRAEEEHGIRFVRCRVSHLDEIPESGSLALSYVEDGEMKREEFDLAVLSVGLRPSDHAGELARVLGIELDEHGFCATRPFSPSETSRAGVYVCGAFSMPMDIPDGVAQASGAASKAAGLMAEGRGSLVSVKEYPQERDVEGEEPRIGAFICHCGINIGGVVDVPEVVRYAGTLPGVAYAEDNLYSCSQDAQESIKEKIRERRLNRVVVASCTPRTHEPLFRNTIREAGLNEYLFEMANIRDQCSWVHTDEPERATEKAKDLVRMTVAKARLLRPLEKPSVGVTPVGLVIGGGLSGMTAALELARQGFEAHLVEKEEELGGNLRDIRYALGDVDPQAQLKSIIREVRGERRIHVHTGARIVDIEGYVGNYATTLASGGEERRIEHGAIIVATGGVEYRPGEYLYGADERVVTQIELEQLMAEGGLDAETVVMIQCVGSRNDERPYCSRICCGEAVKNALKIKELSPDTEVYVLYRDIRTYGLMEGYYAEAASRGVLFIRYDEGREPEVSSDGGLRVLVTDPVLREEVLLEPDLLVLSVATLPNPENRELAQMMKVPLSKDGFFLEAHMKLRPVDFATDGIFLCGLAHSPKFIDESISQACGAAARAATVLSKESLEIEGAIARVDDAMCSGCGMCEAVCRYGAVQVGLRDGEPKAEVLEALCKGCGTCASACPAKAITMEHFADGQILAQVRAALMEEAVP